MENIKIKLVAPRKNIPVLVGKIEFFVNGIKIWADFKEKSTDIYFNEVLIATRNDRKLMFTQIFQMVAKIIVPLECEEGESE